MAGKIRVMIVDDHERVRHELVASLTRSETVEVVGATASSDEAARWLTERRPDVVLLDVKRDDGGGMDLCRRLTTNGHDCAVLILTSYLSREEWREARAAGATDYLFKQIDSKALLAKITEAVQQSSGRPDGRAASA